ncbi:potassium channel family protein [Cryptosporangium minutisporangium]|uniref:Potassium channel domain-containing protein n=1 Tax=Cryptosporangium minutisporangium TaxID=113569 RepID=A0ABP6SZW1_9ACTN
MATETTGAERPGTRVRGRGLKPVPATLLRSAITTTLLLGTYYAVPAVPARTSWGVLVLVIAGAVAVVSVLILQFRAISRSPVPRLRAIQALAVAAPLFLVVFATAYLMLAGVDRASFSEPLSHHDALYFTITVFSTTGFGDVVPQTGAARLLASAQMIGGMVFLGLGIRFLVTAAQIGAAGRRTE